MPRTDSSRMNKYRSVYSKEKQRELDPGILSEAVVKWLKEELGHRPGRTSLVTEDVSENELTKEVIQKVCKKEFIPIFRFLVDNVKSSKEVARIRQQQVAGASVKNSSVRGPKLEKKSKKINARIVVEEKQTETLIAKIDEVESEIRKLRFEIDDKRNKLYMKRAYHAVCEDIIETTKKHEKIVNESKGNTAVSEDIKLKLGTETSTMLEVKEICEKIKLFVHNMISNDGYNNEKIIANIRMPVDDLVKRIPSTVILKSISNVMKSTTHDLKIQSDEYVQRFKETGNEDAHEIQRLLHQSQLNHVDRFVETEKILNEMSGIEDKIEMKLRKIGNLVQSGYSHAPSLSNQIMLAIKSKAETEAAQASFNKLQNHAELLKSQCAAIGPRNDELNGLIDLVTALDRTLKEKKTAIQSLIKFNSSIRSNLVVKINETINFVEDTLIPFSSTIEPLSKDIDERIIRESESIMLSLLVAMTSLTCLFEFSMSRCLDTLGVYRTHDDEFIQYIKRALRIPSQTAIEEIFPAIDRIKREGLAYELAFMHLKYSMKACHFDFQSMVNQMLFSVRANNISSDMDETYSKTIDASRSAVDILKKRLRRQEQEFLSNEVEKLKQEISKAENAEDIINDIQEIIAEK
ncbi:8737_t:CDS:10 [Paraglomus brasilianum]|uniref:8737_t:CDS:1 n=1 Tax=Paraglomus brasilianum TaxID=144538 RepID=A0A9N8WQ16_9GLOM|nr:8737_t:CDS:10 [Paraglomus brasilianum]